MNGSLQSPIGGLRMEIRPPTTRWHSATAWCVLRGGRILFLTHCNLHVFPFFDYHRCSESSQGICTDVFTSADVGDVTDVKPLMKRLCLVVVRQQIRLPDFIFLIHLVDDQLGVPKCSEHGNAGFEGEFQSYNQGLVFSCIV